MNIKMKLKELIKKFIRSYKSSSSTYIKYIQETGGKIGNHTEIFAPESVYIDLSRPYLLEIGDYCSITRGCIILTHDYSHSVLLKKYGLNIGDAKKTIIGNNVFIGMHTIVLMGSRIGNNSIVGAGSVVTGVFPDNVVIAGNPARVICSLEEYYKKKKAQELECAYINIKACKEALNRYPTVLEMGDAFAWLYLPRTKENIAQYSHFFELAGTDYEKVKDMFLDTQPMFESYLAFLESYEKWEMNKED